MVSAELLCENIVLICADVDSLHCSCLCIPVSVTMQDSLWTL